MTRILCINGDNTANFSHICTNHGSQPQPAPVRQMAGHIMSEKTEYEPNYKVACCVCGQKPTVDVKTPGEPIYHTELCGPCCFGEAECIDPKKW